MKSIKSLSAFCLAAPSNDINFLENSASAGDKLILCAICINVPMRGVEPSPSLLKSFCGIPFSSQLSMPSWVRKHIDSSAATASSVKPIFINPHNVHAWLTLNCASSATSAMLTSWAPTLASLVFPAMVRRVLLKLSDIISLISETSSAPALSPNRLNIPASAWNCSTDMSELNKLRNSVCS